MLTASLALAALALALAWPAPVILARADWPARAPVTALVLWQAIALAGGLSMIGSLLTYSLIPFGPDLVTSATTFLRTVAADPIAPAVPLHYLLSLSAGILLAAHLIFNFVLTVVQIERQRRRHRELVALLSSPSPDRPNTRILDSAMPVAYCLPGTRNSVTVFSAGLMRLLDEAELQAVIEHEKAHLSQRHYMVLLAFDAWRTSLPWFPIATRAQREVGMLVEMIADDQARRVADDATLASAIVLVSGDAPAASLPDRSRSPLNSALPQRESDTRARVARLMNGAAPLPPAARALVMVTAVALVAVPTLLLFAPVVLG